MDFVSIDVETANADMSSICAVGLVRFESGRAIGGIKFLINPDDYFDPMNVAIHGISEEMVVGAPKMPEVLPVMSRHLGDRIVVHHTHFDRVALQQAAARHGQDGLPCRWLDSARVARRAWPAVAQSGYGLRPLADEFGITFEHHDPQEDARAAGLILIRAIQETGMSLSRWFERVEQPLDLDRASHERQKQSGDPSGHLYGNTVVFTGALTMARADAARVAMSAGLNVHPAVTKETTLLVVGDQDVRRLNGNQKSTKHMKAEKMIAAGHPIKIIDESGFMRLLQLA